MGNKLKAFIQKLKSDFLTVWNNSRVFLFILGAIMLVVKFRNILTDLIVANSKSLFNGATKENAVDQKKEDDANKAADALVTAAQDLPNSEKPVDEDWNTKK